MKLSERLEELAEGERSWIYDQLDGTSFIKDDLEKVDEKVKDSKAQILQDLEDIVGEDEKPFDHRLNRGMKPDVGTRIRNQLRQEIRENLRKYCEIEK